MFPGRISGRSSTNLKNWGAQDSCSTARCMGTHGSTQGIYIQILTYSCIYYSESKGHVSTCLQILMHIQPRLEVPQGGMGRSRWECDICAPVLISLANSDGWGHCSLKTLSMSEIHLIVNGGPGFIYWCPWHGYTYVFPPEVCLCCLQDMHKYMRTYTILKAQGKLKAIMPRTEGSRWARRMFGGGAQPMGPPQAMAPDYGQVLFIRTQDELEDSSRDELNPSCHHSKKPCELHPSFRN